MERMRNVPKFPLFLLALFLAVTFLFPHLTQAGLGLGFLKTPFGGKVTLAVPNPPALPTVPPAPNPCYVVGSYLLTIGTSIYVLEQSTDVINGMNPPMSGVWALGLAEQGTSACKTITLIGVSGLF